MSDAPTRLRREPPPLRRLSVLRTEPRSIRMMRVVVGGPELDGLELPEPAASVRLLVPWPGEAFELPTWNGNEFLLADQRRPALRTFTPVALDEDELTIDIVRHPGGAISDWSETAEPGDPCAVSGPGRGETIDESAERYVLLGDETAIPAIEQLLGVIPASIEVEVHLEVEHPDARLRLPSHPAATVTWHDAIDGDRPGASLRGAVADATIDPGTRVWAAGEAAAVQAIRKHLFDDRDMPRAHTTIRGYWKVPRTPA
ncbi:MAG: siderophore-interacting protein [Actinomycetota bacterium]